MPSICTIEMCHMKQFIADIGHLQPKSPPPSRRRAARHTIALPRRPPAPPWFQGDATGIENPPNILFRLISFASHGPRVVTAPGPGLKQTPYSHLLAFVKRFLIRG